MQIFQNEQDRLTLDLFEQHRQQGFQGLLALPLGGELKRRVARFRQGKGQQGCQQRHGFCQGKTVFAQGVFESCQALCRRLFRLLVRLCTVRPRCVALRTR